MRLRRVEAGRFGRIDGRTLGDLSPRLTVVHGPNEAGKSSFTALVRHVLYGFPTPADIREAAYVSDAGKREGRLVFTDGDGEWVVERKEGSHGGPVTVSALSGGPRDGLVSELTAGVSRLAYRVVLGFGLSEMQQIEELKGCDDDLLARLYAAGAGLRVSPIDVRAKLDSSMDTLWKKGGSSPELNRAKAERERVRVEIRALAAEGETLREDALRLEVVEREYEDAKSCRTETRVGAERIARVTAEAERLLAEAATAGLEAERLGREASAARSEARAIAADPSALAVAEEIEALAGELSGFREQLATLVSGGSRLASIEARLRAAVRDTGWSEERALAAAGDAGVAAEIDVARERLAKLQARLDYAVTARDAARSAGAGEAASESGPSRPWLVPGLVVAAIGAAGAVAGLALSQMLLAVFAGAFVVVGVGLALWSRGGTAGGTGAAFAARIATTEQECAAAEEALAAWTVTWSEWVRSRGLGDGSEDPAAVATRYQAARTVQAADAERVDLAAALDRGRASAEAFARRVRDVVGPLLGEPDAAMSLERVPELTDRGRERVVAARKAAGSAAASIALAERLERDAVEVRSRQEEAARRMAAALEEAGAPGGLEDARTRAVEARALADDACEAYDRTLAEVQGLRARLGSERRDTALAELRLTEETLGEQIAAGVRDYAVLTLASRLLTLAQERYERDRQPEVVKRAEAAFATMTNGRYERIAVPLGKDAIEVFDAAAAATSPNRLSRGTAEQLYLALRLGLIEQLGDAGAGLPVLMDDVLVNFSPNRIESAARAIADLATRRQVVFFTCHPATADLLCRVAPDAVRLELAPPV